ncbi:MAG: hypothetical protein K8S18_00675 [Desulfobacula sp.]|nr:hypothetical protein [Desulfobacula sp.]
MKRKYLGDSYDALKRLWQELLYKWAPLYATPDFIPTDLQHEFAQLTRIPSKVKMGQILSEGFHSFYYVSHAPFLFAVLNKDALSQIQDILKNSGIPENRFEKYQ